MISSLLIFILGWTFPKDQDFELLDTVMAPGTKIASDHLNNFYLINSEGSLIKYIPGKKDPAIFSTTQYGRLAYVDATNPMKLLLFYPEYETIVALDDDLSEVGKFQLLYKGYTDISAIAMAQDNDIWIYDNIEEKLKKINDKGEVVMESDNLQNLGMDVEPVSMRARNNWVYVNDPSKGILVFDIYGTYYKTISIKGMEYFQILEKKLYYFSGIQLMVFNLETLEEISYTLPLSKINAGSVQRNRLFLSTGSEIMIYSIKN